MELKEFFVKPIAYIQHLFATGFLFLLPIALTFSLFSFFFNLIKKWLGPIKQLDIPIVNNIPYSEFLVFFFFIFLLGILIKAFILKPLIIIFEESLSKIPMIRTVYKGIKQLVYAFSSHDEKSFKKVVLIQYPRAGAYSIGFLTKEIPLEVSKHNLVGVYVPHTPNPATGNFIMVPVGEIEETDLTRQEATALVISGGIVQPVRPKK